MLKAAEIISFPQRENAIYNIPPVCSVFNILKGSNEIILQICILGSDIASPVATKFSNIL